MKLSVLPVSLFPQLSTQEMTVAQWAKFAQGLQVDGFDTSILFYPSSTPVTLNKIKRELKEQEISIEPVMVCCYPDFTNPDALERERQMDYFRRDLALVSDLGFQYVRTTAGQNHPGIGIEEGAKRCVECFEKVLPAAEKYGVKLVLENHGHPGAWPMVDFSFDPRAFLAIYERMKELPMGINFDPANAVACGADACELLEKVMDKVWTIHMNDTSEVGRITPTEIGQGLVDYDEVFRVLNRYGFDGWVCIEEASGNGLPGIERAVRMARNYVK